MEKQRAKAARKLQRKAEKLAGIPTQGSPEPEVEASEVPHERDENP